MKRIDFSQHARAQAALRGVLMKSSMRFIRLAGCPLTMAVWNAEKIFRTINSGMEKHIR